MVVHQLHMHSNKIFVQSFQALIGILRWYVKQLRAQQSYLEYYQSIAFSEKSSLYMYFFGLIFKINLDLKPPLGSQEISWTKKTLGVFNQHQLKISIMEHEVLISLILS